MRLGQALPRQQAIEGRGVQLQTAVTARPGGPPSPSCLLTC